MATIYINDDTLFEYAEEHGSIEDGKEAIQELVEENAPGGGSTDDSE